MASDSDGKLTRFESAVTVVTADFANSLFGGLSGTGAGELLDPSDPRVLGHVHSGKNLDGHGPKVDLVDHVENRLTNTNLADAAVTPRNVRGFPSRGDSIPEYRDIGTTRYYYLDLRSIRSDFTFQEDETPSSAHSGISENKLIKQRDQEFNGSSYVPIPDIWTSSDGFDFVFGSSSLEDLNLATGDGDSRFFFDKSIGSFRAGSVDSDQWDLANRGDYSIALGRNGTASGENSTISGGADNTSSGDGATVSGGTNNSSLADSSVVSGGRQNTVESAAESSNIGGGYSNQILLSSGHSVVSGGENNKIESSIGRSVISGGKNGYVTSDYSVISGGLDAQVSADYSTVSGGRSGQASAEYSTVAGGNLNHASGTHSSISGGDGNQSQGDWSVVSGGQSNQSSGVGSVVSGGTSNQANGTGGVISGGSNNALGSSFAVIAGGHNNVIEANSDFSAIVGGGSGTPGDGNTISRPFSMDLDGDGIGDIPAEGPSSYSGIFGGEGNWITGGDGPSAYNFISSGHRNKIGAAAPMGSVSNNYQIIVGGSENSISNAEGAFENNGIAFGKFCSMASGAESIDGSVVIGGSYNRLQTNQGPGGILTHCSIVGGWSNIIGQTPNDKGGALLSIIGGSQNSIDSSSPDYATGISSHSSIIGGLGNKITVSKGSVICGGGAIVDYSVMGTVGDNWAADPGLLIDTFYSNPGGKHGNEIEGSDYAGILAGANNLIRKGDGDAFYSSIVAGFENLIDGAAASSIQYGYGNVIDYGPITNNPSRAASASGLESNSYLYGQNSQASGTWNLNDSSFMANGLSGQPTLYGGGAGGSQTFVLTMFGHWNYPLSLTSAGSPGTEVELLLDGKLSGTAKLFEPRQHSSYTYKIYATLNCTDNTNTKHMISFSYEGGIFNDGTPSYGYGAINPINVIFSTGPTISNSPLPGAPTVNSPDFYFYFIPQGSPASVPRVKGGIATLSSGGVGDGFLGVLYDNSSDYWLASVTARIEVVENNLWYQTT